MVTLVEIDIGKVVGGRLNTLAIDQQTIIDVETNAIIRCGIEAIVASAEVIAARVKRTEVVVVDSTARSTRAPIEIDGLMLGD